MLFLIFQLNTVLLNRVQFEMVQHNSLTFKHGFIHFNYFLSLKIGLALIWVQNETL